MKKGKIYFTATLILTLISFVWIGGCVGNGYTMTEIRISVNSTHNVINLTSLQNKIDPNDIPNSTFSLMLLVGKEQRWSNFILYENTSLFLLNMSPLKIKRPIENHEYKVTVSILVNSTKFDINNISFFHTNGERVNSFNVTIKWKGVDLYVKEEVDIEEVVLDGVSNRSDRLRIYSSLWIDIHTYGYCAD